MRSASQSISDALQWYKRTSLDFLKHIRSNALSKKNVKSKNQRKNSLDY